MATYTFNDATASEIGGQMTAISNRLLQVIQTLDTTTAQQLTDWEDTAKDAWKQCQTEWDQAAQFMPQALSAAVNALNNISENYVAVTRSGTQMWSS